MRFGHGAAKFLGGFDPLLGDALNGAQGLGFGRAVGHAAGQLGNLRDESAVLVTPVDDHLVLHGTIRPSPGRANGGVRLNQDSLRPTGGGHHEN